MRPSGVGVVLRPGPLPAHPLAELLDTAGGTFHHAAARELPDRLLRRSGGDQPPVRVLLGSVDLAGVCGGAKDRRCAEDDGRPWAAAAHREQCRTAGNPSVR